MRADGPDRTDRLDRAGSKRGPGPVTGEFGRIGFYRRMSVTGPSNWRKATWLVVAMASVVLVVLVFGAVRLAGPNGRSEQVDAFPGLPTGGLLTPQPRGSSTLALPHTQSNDDDQGMPTPTQPQTGTQASLETPAGDRPDTRSPDVDSSSGPTGGLPPSSGGAASSSGPGGDVDVVDVTDRFFGLLPEDVNAAWLMMDSQGRQQDFAEFSRSWRRYQDVELRHVTVGTDETTVIASIKVTEHKGTSATQNWKLTFRRGGEPVIDELVLLDPGTSANGLPVNTP